MVAKAEAGNPKQHQSTSRRLRSISAKEIVEATANEHGVSAIDYRQFRSKAAGREMAAWLCRRWSGATLEELGAFFGISGTGSVSNLVRQAQTRHDQSRSWKAKATNVEHDLNLNTQHKA